MDWDARKDFGTVFAALACMFYLLCLFQTTIFIHRKMKKDCLIWPDKKSGPDYIGKRLCQAFSVISVAGSCVRANPTSDARNAAVFRAHRFGKNIIRSIGRVYFLFRGSWVLLFLILVPGGWLCQFAQRASLFSENCFWTPVCSRKACEVWSF